MRAPARAARAAVRPAVEEVTCHNSTCRVQIEDYDPEMEYLVEVISPSRGVRDLPPRRWDRTATTMPTRTSLTAGEPWPDWAPICGRLTRSHPTAADAAADAQVAARQAVRGGSERARSALGLIEGRDRAAAGAL